MSRDSLGIFHTKAVQECKVSSPPYILWVISAVHLCMHSHSDLVRHKCPFLPFSLAHPNEWMCRQVMHQRNKYLRNIQQGAVVGSFKLDIKTVYDAVGSTTFACASSTHLIPTNQPTINPVMVYLFLWAFFSCFPGHSWCHGAVPPCATALTVFFSPSVFVKS